MRIKKNFLFIYIFIFLASSIFSTTKWNFNISPYAGFSYNNLEEFFFSDIRTSEKISLLKWDATPLWSLGLNFSASYKKIILDVDFEYSLPFHCGTMYDSDWDVFNGLKVIYSESEIHNKNTLATTLSFSYKLFEGTVFSLLPLINIDYRYFSFEARNGFGWYGTETKTHGEVAWNDPLAKYYAPGQLNGLDFSKHSFELFTGVTIHSKIKKFNINCSALLSPFSYFYTMDIHLSKISNHHFEQIQYCQFQRFKINADLIYHINKSISPFISATFSWGYSAKGKLYSENPSSPSKKLYLMSQKSGSNQTIFSLKSGITVHI